MIGKHLKDYKKAYLAERKKYKKTCVKKNSDWRKRWLPFIKYDHDFDGIFFLDIIVHKLHIMLDYYEHGKYCWQVDESRLEIVESLREACRLGDMLIADEFNEPAYEIMHAHMHTHSEPCETELFGKKQTLSKLVSEWDSPENEELYRKAEKAGEEFKAKTEKEFFEYLCKHYEEWWD